MAIISRVSSLLLGDMHAVLDRLEEPELVLKQSIREMEEVLQAQRLRAKHTSASLRRHSRRADELDIRIKDLDEQLDVSVAAKRMDTSRNIVKRKLETEALRGMLNKRTQELEEQLCELREAIAKCEAQLEAVREKSQVLFDNDDENSTDSSLDEPMSWTNDRDVEAALLREIQRRSVP